MVCVEVEGGGVHRVTGEKGTWTVLDVAHGLVVAQFASPSTPPKLVSGRLKVSLPMFNLLSTSLACWGPSFCSWRHRLLDRAW